MKNTADQFSVKINRQKKSIDISEGTDWVYDIDLEQCETSAQVLDWIMQLYSKTWCTPDLLFRVIRALDMALGGIQASICPLGVDKAQLQPTMTVAQKAQAVERELDGLGHLPVDDLKNAFDAVMKTYRITDPALKRELWLESKRIHEQMHHRGSVVPFPIA